MSEVGSDRRREDALLAKSLESVRGEHLAPLVSVVAGGIASSEDMTESGGNDMLWVLRITLPISQGGASQGLTLVGVEVIWEAFAFG